MTVLTHRRLEDDTSCESAPADAPVEQTLTAVIDTLGAELAELALCGEGLQDLASRVMLAESTDDLVTDLQVVDLLVQRLNALSTFARTLAPKLPGEWRVDVAAATRALPLAETRNRLEGRSLASDDRPIGECDFF